MQDAIIIGSGLAGLACGLDLVEKGAAVSILEASQVVGGRTSSWNQDGMLVESGLHKFLGIYRALPELLTRVGIDLNSMLTWTDEVVYHIPGGPDARFTLSPYHHPIATAVTAASNTDFLPTVDKVKLGEMAAAGMAKVMSDPVGLDEVSIAAYAAAWGVSDEVINRVLSTSTQAVLFLPAEEFSAYAAFAPAVEGMKHGMTMRVGGFNGGMTEVMMTPIVRAIEKQAGVVRTGAEVTELLVEDGRVVGVAVAEERLLAKTVVLATSLKPAQNLLAHHFSSMPWCEDMLRLPSLSAVTIHFEVHAPVLEHDSANFSPTEMCCFAEQSRTTFRHAPGRFSAILYPPEKFIHLLDEQILERAYLAADEMQLPLRGHVTAHRVIRHKHDFYAMRPGTESLRPPQSTSLPGLVLAGDYTKQPYSASMEGAVISGQRAAEAVMAGL